MVDVRALVGTRELLEVVNINTHFARDVFIVIDSNHHTVSINIVNNTATLGLDCRLGVHGHRTFHTRTDNRFFRPQARNALTLHVGTHQSAVGVIVFQERNQGSGGRNDLQRRDVHVLDTFRANHHGFTVFTGAHQFLSQATFVIQLGVSLADDVLTFFNSGEVINLIGHLAVNHLTIRRFQEAVFIQASIQSQRVNQTNVRAFRRFNRAQTTVVSRVHVTHFEACAFTGQTTGTQSGNTTLMGDFRQRIGLVHELAQLAGAKEFTNSSGNRLTVDQILRR